MIPCTHRMHHNLNIIPVGVIGREDDWMRGTLATGEGRGQGSLQSEATWGHGSSHQGLGAIWDDKYNIKIL